MRILVKAKSRAKEDKVVPPQPRLIPNGEEVYIVYTKEPPVDGRANEGIAKLLAEYFGVARRGVKLISGATSKVKVFEVDS